MFLCVPRRLALNVGISGTASLGVALHLVFVL